MITDMSGNVFGKLTVVKRDGTRSGQPTWLCNCSCGNIKITSGDSLRRGLTASCGCIRNKDKITHGASNKPEYAIWRSMRARCNNRKDSAFNDYGGRGIRVCDKWNSSFDNFIADVGHRPSDEYTLDREDNNGNYEPNNCRWATRTTQARNRRNNRTITLNGVETTLYELSEKTGEKYSTLYMRHIVRSK